MIALIGLGFAVCLVLANLLGLSLAALSVTRHYALARAAGILVAAAPLFFLEHFAGLGKLAWVWPLATAASALLIRKHLALIRANWRTEALFAGGFLYAFAWRFAFPDLDPSSEKLTDLGFIANYLPGTTLPPVDRWLPPHLFDVYYGLQFYGAALLGRIFNLDIGLAYHLGFCAVVGATVTAAGEAARLFCGSGRRWLLPLAVFVLGGTGASPLAPLLSGKPQLHDGMRFIGGSATPARADTALGKWLVAAAGVPASDAIELPAETFGYLVPLGDFHPPMGGFYLLALALLAMALAEREGSRAAQAVMAATVPLTLATDAWNFPLQALLLVCWAACRADARKPPDWKACAAGLALGLLLVAPFLQGFGPRSLDYQTALRLTPGAERTPPLLGLIVLYPLLGLVAACLAARDRTRLAAWLAVFCLLLLAASEIWFVDDVYSGRFNRFNTTLKWWPWIWTAALIAVGSLNLASASRACRRLTVAAMIAPGLFSADLAAHLLFSPKPHAGRMSGDAWLVSDPAVKSLLEHLRREATGIVLQRPEAEAFTPSPALTMFAGQTAFLGWPAHEKLWRGGRIDIEVRHRQLQRFYRGELEDAARWLAENRIDHVLWLPGESALPPGSFEKIQAQIGAGYFWSEHSAPGGRRTGVWSRRRP